jgi:hypothetical protein
MSLVEGALSQLGVDIGAVDQVGSVIGSFNSQNLTPNQILNTAQTIGNLITGGPQAIGIGAPAQAFSGSSGEWQSTRYAYDLNSHHPKLKFLFKVGFFGFVPEVREFYFYVHRCDKPKVKILHTDVNFYNFRSKVMTGVIFEPLTMEFLDESGNSVNEFFVAYMKERSGTGGGGWGIQNGFGSATSSKPYTVNGGYGGGERITVEQIFANGTRTNQFHYINPRIESFDFNELTMEETAGSMMTIQFSYDALSCDTIGQYSNPTWGETDLLRAGGTSGPGNGGSSSLGESGVFTPGSASGGGIGPGSSGTVYQGGLLPIATALNIPGSMSNLISQGIQQISQSNIAGIIGSAGDTLSSNIQNTLQSITSGNNLQFNGADTPVTTYSVPTPDVSVTDISGDVINSQTFP